MGRVKKYIRRIERAWIMEKLVEVIIVAVSTIGIAVAKYIIEKKGD